MTRTITYAQLLQTDRDINAAPLYIHLLFGEKLKRFYTLNKIRLEVARTKVTELIRKYVECTENGVPKTIAKEDGSTEYVWKLPGSKAAYDKECGEFLNISFEIQL